MALATLATLATPTAAVAHHADVLSIPSGYLLGMTVIIARLIATTGCPSHTTAGAITKTGITAHIVAMVIAITTTMADIADMAAIVDTAASASAHVTAT